MNPFIFLSTHQIMANDWQKREEEFLKLNEQLEKRSKQIIDEVENVVVKTLTKSPPETELKQKYFAEFTQIHRKRSVRN